MLYGNLYVHSSVQKRDRYNRLTEKDALSYGCAYELKEHGIFIVSTRGKAYVRRPRGCGLRQ